MSCSPPRRRAGSCVDPAGDRRAPSAVVRGPTKLEPPRAPPLIILPRAGWPCSEGAAPAWARASDSDDGGARRLGRVADGAPQLAGTDPVIYACAPTLCTGRDWARRKSSWRLPWQRCLVHLEVRSRSRTRHARAFHPSLPWIPAPHIRTRRPQGTVRRARSTIFFTRAQGHAETLLAPLVLSGECMA